MNAVSLDALDTVSYMRSNVRKAPVGDDAALRRVTAEFEAIFLGEMLKAMRATQMDSGLFGQERSSKMYREMHDEALANSMATAGETPTRPGGFGLGRMLYEELRRQRPA